MRKATKHKLVEYLQHTLQRNQQWLKLCTISLCVAGFAACGGESNNTSHAEAASNSTTSPAISDAQAVTLSKVALSTFPRLPIDIGQQTVQYPQTGQGFAPTGDLPLQTDSNLQMFSLDTPVNTEIHDCSAGGLVNIEREPLQAYDSDVSTSVETAITLEFIECATQNTTDLTVQGGSIAITTSFEVDKHTSERGADLLANLNDYSHAVLSDTATATYWVDGEFGISAQSNADSSNTRTMFAANGTINNPDGSQASTIQYDRFGIVLEQSNQQDLIYIYGTVIADMENEQYRYTISTIEPMGTVNDDVQGRLLIESEGSKLFIDRTNTEEVTLSADYDDDGSIDYSTIIALPLNDLINASSFTMLPL